MPHLFTIVALDVFGVSSWSVVVAVRLGLSIVLVLASIRPTGGGHVSLMQRRWQSGGNAFPPMKRGGGGGGGAFWGDEHCQTTWELWKLSEENTWVYEGKHLIKERQAATYNVPFNCRFLSK